MKRPNTYVNFYGHIIDVANFLGASQALVGTRRFVVIDRRMGSRIEIPVESQRRGNVLIHQIRELATNPELVKQGDAWLKYANLSLNQYLRAYANESGKTPARTVLSEQDLPVEHLLG